VTGFERFAFTSRGDVVEGRLWCPPTATRHPLVLITPGVGDCAALPALTWLGETLASAGVAAACFDLPLQGERASRKLSGRLQQAATSAEPTRAEAQLYAAFSLQVAADLSAARTALCSRSDIEPGRLGCLALEPGAEAAARWAERAGDVRLARCEVSNAHSAVQHLSGALLG
jgi:dienelactone hydrolase